MKFSDPQRLPQPVEHVDWHPVDCACPVCEPYAPSGAQFRAFLGSTSVQVLAGFGLGHLLVAGIGWLTGGPGVLAMYGF